MMNTFSKIFIAPLSFLIVVLSVSCNSCKPKKDIPASYQQVSPEFNADSAYAYIEAQVNFGPRVPNTAQHKACGDYLVAKLESFGAQVTEQKTEIVHYDKQKLPIRNIIGSFFPEKEKRILLFAHWDTRPFADREPDADKHHRPILGADDGASGVGVLLEIARHLQQTPTEYGIDIIFFDMEDWGQPHFDEEYVPGEWWCMGSQYWAKNPHIENYKARYGILLDMVGAPDATFTREGYSMKYASNIVDKIWRTASKLGYGQFFLSRNGGFITDDHVPVNEIRRIPSANIINIKDDTETGFGLHWHTLNDDMRNINKSTLKAAGQTVMEVIYLEK